MVKVATVGKLSEATFTLSELQETCTTIMESQTGKDKALVAHACLSVAFKIFHLGGANYDQTMLVCKNFAQEFDLEKYN